MAIDHVRARRSTAKLLKATGSLNQIVSKPRKEATPAQQERITALSQQIKAAHTDLRMALGQTPPTADGKGVSSSFDDFFGAVASSFANAQQNLDNKTKEYLAGIQNQKECMPTAFRISKVSADMKFAVDSVDSHSVGIIFYKDTSSTEIQNQQQVHFEMVAAPTPPGTTVSSPSIPLLFSAPTRKRLFDIIAQRINVAGDPTGSANLLGQPNRVLIFPEKPDQVFYLAYADNQKCGLWRLDSTTAKMTVMRAFGPTAGTDLDAIRDTVLRLGTQLEAFLISIGTA
jgi:hypothetical protein